MCTKPFSGPIISQSTKWMNVFRFYLTIDTNTLSTHEIKWFCCEFNGLKRKHITGSHVNLNKANSHGKMSLSVRCKFTPIQINILWWTSHTCDWWNENFIKGFYWFLNLYISNISNIYNPNVNLSIAYQTKCEHIFSYLESDNIFSHFQLHNCYIYIFSLVCGNCPLTLKRGKCNNIL